MRILLLDEAEADLNEAMMFFESQVEGLGLRFKAQVGEALARVQRRPRSWPRFRKRYRLCQLKVFRRYAVLYRIGRIWIFVHGIVNLQRGPKFWKGRL